MQDTRIEFMTTKSVEDCSATFHRAAKSSYGGARRMLRGAAMLRGSGSEGFEFFTPGPSPYSAAKADWQSGVYVPGYSKMHGASRMCVHIYVVDRGEEREVQLVGPYGLGEKGSTERLMNTIRSAF